MATTYKFQVSLPVSDTLARNRCVNVFHMEHVTGGLLDADLQSMCEDIAALWQARYSRADKEVDVRAYDVDATPNYPRAQVVVNVGQFWPYTVPREIALVLSYAADHRGNKSERGRIYLMPFLSSAIVAAPALRPTTAVITWALEWYTKPNESFPDLGGVDWKFGVWSRRYQKFTQSQQAWVNDDWDIQRRRGLRETTRQTATREG